MPFQIAHHGSYLPTVQLATTGASGTVVWLNWGCVSEYCAWVREVAIRGNVCGGSQWGEGDRRETSCAKEWAMLPKQGRAAGSVVHRQPADDQTCQGSPHLQRSTSVKARLLAHHQWLLYAGLARPRWLVPTWDDSEGSSGIRASHGVESGLRLSLSLMVAWLLSLSTLIPSAPSHRYWAQGPFLINILHPKFHLRIPFPGNPNLRR